MIPYYVYYYSNPYLQGEAGNFESMLEYKENKGILPVFYFN